MKNPIKIRSDMDRLVSCYHYFYNINRVNLFLTINQDYGVLGVKGKRIYVAKLDDIGVKP